MIIVNDEKEFSVNEAAKRWIVSRKVGELQIIVYIDKDICGTKEEVEEYVERERLF